MRYDAPPPRYPRRTQASTGRRAQQAPPPRRRRRRRRNPLGMVVLALLAMVSVLLVSYLVMYGSQDLTASARQAAAQLIPALATPTPTPTPTPAPSPAPTPEPTIAPTAPPPSATQPPAANHTNAPGSLPLLINRSHMIGPDFMPSNLVRLVDVIPSSVAKVQDDSTQGDAEAAAALAEMLQGGINDGISPWQISAGFRTFSHQQRLMDEKVAGYMDPNKNNLSEEKAKQAALNTVAPPGASEHHTGLAFDITVPGKNFKGTPQADWLAEHCWEYGFILRYTEDKQSITGYLAEAWHFRYVGVEAAETMRDMDWCLEEYIEYFGAFE